MKKKMSERKFYKTLITVEVLSEEEIPPGEGLEFIANEIKEGDWSGRITREKTAVLNGKQAAKALLAQGSDPEFFQLNKDGEDIE